MQQMGIDITLFEYARPRIGCQATASGPDAWIFGRHCPAASSHVFVFVFFGGLCASFLVWVIYPAKLARNVQSALETITSGKGF
jgi:hypothetical protein